MAQYKYTEDQVYNLFSNGGLRIYTTMNRKCKIALKQ